MMKHLYWMIGLVLVLISFTVLAHAAATTLNCTSAFDCETPAVCGSVTAPAGIGMDYGTCSSDGEIVPCDYSFSLPVTGYSQCIITTTTTNYGNTSGNPMEDNEVMDILVNGNYLGTTVDNYANTDDPLGTAYCGTFTQSITANLSLAATNTISFYPYSSHTLSSVTISCTNIPEPVSHCDVYVLSPMIDDIADKSIYYDELFEMDLWNYVEDYDSTFGEMDITATFSNTAANCTFTNERNISCQGNYPGTTAVTLTATDECGHTDTETFNINVSNETPVLHTPDQEMSCASDMTRFIRLDDYAWDEDINNADYNITAQSNSGMLDCYIDQEHYLTCYVVNCQQSYTDINMRITDVFGLTYNDSFRITLKNFAPYFKTEFSSVCLNQDTYRFLDLRDYAYDTEDKNNLIFSITNQSNTNTANCFIESNYYLSCNTISNLHSYNTITIKATDSNGSYVTKDLNIGTNCYNAPAGATGEYIFESDIKGICLEKCTDYSTNITVKNASNASKCFNFLVDDVPSEINVSLTNPSFCLNKGESTYLTFNANTCGAASSSYTARIHDDAANMTMNFGIDIGSCSSYDGFRIEEFDGTICKGEKKDVTVLVTNTSSASKRIYLNADNAFMLPFFSREYLDVAGGETKTATLALNAKNLSLGMQRVQLNGVADNYTIEKKLDVEVVDCSNIIERTFMLGAADVCYDVVKGQIFEGTFTVKCLAKGDDCSFDKKKFALKLFGLEGQLGYDEVSMTCSQEKAVPYTIVVPTTMKAGKNYFSIVGIDLTAGEAYNAYTEEKQICLNVKGESNAGITLRTQAKDISWCATEIFEFEIKNSGDFDENFALSTANLPVGIRVAFSEDVAFIPKGTSKIIYLSVSTSPTTEVKDGQSFKVKLDGNVHIETTIYFNVKGIAALEDIEILGATEKITMKTNTDANYYITIRNNSDRNMTELEVSFEGAGDLNMPKLTLDFLAPGQVVTLNGTVHAGDKNGTYTPYFVVSQRNSYNKRALEVVVEKAPESQGGALAGMFSLFSGTGLFGGSVGGLGTIAAIGFALFIILLIFIVILGIASTGSSSNKQSKEVWMVKE